VITLVFPMPDEKKIGLIVLGCAAARHSCLSWLKTLKAASASVLG
jgi:hypothetical protein